jgi:hypothetical protein
MRGFTVSLAIGLVTLAACSKPADNSAASTTNAAGTPAAAAPATPAVAAGPAGPITLAQLPAPTAGQWSRTSTQDGKQEPPGSKCLDGKPIDPLDKMPMKCSKMDATRTASGGFVVIAECSGAGVGMTAKLTLAGEGDFAKSFSTDATMDMTGGPGGAVHTKNHSDWTYVGPTCTK